MDRKDYIFYMTRFLDSNEFKNRSIIEDKNDFIDKGTGLVYFKKINSIKEIDSIDVVDGPSGDSSNTIPVIYLSDKPRVIHLIGGSMYNSNKWDESRMNTMKGFEFDYAYLIQCRSLDVKPYCYWN